MNPYRTNAPRYAHGKVKTVVTVVLLAFVAASIVYLIFMESGGKPSQETSQINEPSDSVEQQEKTSAASQKKPVRQKVIVYYFHGNMRCKTCRTIESYAKQAVETGFPQDLQDGHVEWKVVNVDQPANDHYVEDFQLTTRSVVLERLINDKREEWNNLPRVWELVRDKEAFQQYIQDEIRAYREAASP